MTPVNHIDLFESSRPKLFGLAYRLTGSITDAEDIIQELFLKWQTVILSDIESPTAWLTTVATRMALDHLKSARVQRESYVGPWLPEPYIETHRTPETEHELDESIAMALLVLLEQLTPGERASFILHDLFQFRFEEISPILQRSDAACRKLASRARDKISRHHPLAATDKTEHHRIVHAFFTAVKTGDTAALIHLLQDSVVLHTDGGGKAVASLSLLQGHEAVTDFLMQRVRPGFTACGTGSATLSYTWFNGSPGFVIWARGYPQSAFNFDIAGSRVQNIHVLRNPDKLRFFRREKPL